MSWCYIVIHATTIFWRYQDSFISKQYFVQCQIQRNEVKQETRQRISYKRKHSSVLSIHLFIPIYCYGNKFAVAHMRLLIWKGLSDKAMKYVEHSNTFKIFVFVLWMWLSLSLSLQTCTTSEKLKSKQISNIKIN